MIRRDFIKTILSLPAAFALGAMAGKKIESSQAYYHLRLGETVSEHYPYYPETAKEEMMADYMSRGMRGALDSLPFTEVK